MTIGEWLDLVEPIAIGECGMTWQQFDDATPREVQWRIDGLNKNKQRELRNIAQLAAWVLTPFAKDPLVVTDLVKFEDEEQAKFDWSKWMKG